MKISKQKFMDYIEGYEHEELYRAVIKSYGMTWQNALETFMGVDREHMWALSSRHGAFQWGGSQKFAKKYWEEIWWLALDRSDEFGQGVIEMIASFNVCKLAGFKEKDIIKGLIFSDSKEREILFDHLAIYALEETARFVTDIIKQMEEENE